MHRPLVSRTPVVAEANAPGHDRPNEYSPRRAQALGAVYLFNLYSSITGRQPVGSLFLFMSFCLLRLHLGYPKAVIRPP